MNNTPPISHLRRPLARVAGRHRPLRAVPGVLAVLAFTAACASDTSPADPSSSETAATAVEVRIVPERGGVGVFDPLDVSVAAGGTVTWSNESGFPHNVVFAPDSGVTSSKIFPSGETYTASFDTPGLYPYDCIIHPGMSGTVTVTD